MVDGVEADDTDDTPPVCMVDGVEADFIDCVDGYLANGSGISCHQACFGDCCDDGENFGNACAGFTGEYHILCYF